MNKILCPKGPGKCPFWCWGYGCLEGFDDEEIDMTLKEMEERYPTILWKEPVEIKLVGDTIVHYGCRICIANYGIKSDDVSLLPTDPQQIIKHIYEVHTQPKETKDVNE